MKIAVLTDVHANLPALEAVVGQLERIGYDIAIHLGDAIGIGPFPAECVELLHAMPNMRFVRGNHDDWFVRGLPTPQPKWMGDGELAHQQWTHGQLTATHKALMAEWPFVLTLNCADTAIACQHYGLDETGEQFASIIKNPSPNELDALFGLRDVDIVCYGHHHPFLDVQGVARYINPGALGCSYEPEARFTTITCTQGEYVVDHHRVRYDAESLFAAFEQRQVPDRELIQKAFFGRRMYVKGLDDNKRTFTLWLETELGDPDQAANRVDKNFCNISVTLDTGVRYALNIWTFDFLPLARYDWPYKFDANIKPASYLLPPDLFVERLVRSEIESIVSQLISNGEMRDEWIVADEDDE